MTDETKTAAREALVEAILGAYIKTEHGQWLAAPSDAPPRFRALTGAYADAILASPALDAIVAERVAELAADELRVAALAHVIEWYAGPDDDTIPVLRHWLTALADREVGA